MLGTDRDRVVWQRDGDEVLVHLESLRAECKPGLLLVYVELETDQTGRAPLVVTFALPRCRDEASLLAVTEELPRGDRLLAARWGRPLQDALWAALLEVAGAAGGGRARGLVARERHLLLLPMRPLAIAPRPEEQR